MDIRARIKVYADGASKEEMVNRYRKGGVDGFTTNPTLMVKAGIRNYERFAVDVLSEIQNLPISFEVFSDEFNEMELQAMKIGSWAKNVNVKIPITNTRGEASLPLIRRLLDRGLKLNVTALLTDRQIDGLHEILEPGDDVIVSIFAGRIADTGVDPIPVMKRAVQLYKDLPDVKILWASPREVLNIYQAADAGCHIITASDQLIEKLSLNGKPLEAFSLETVKMFYDDAVGAGFTL